LEQRFGDALDAPAWHRARGCGMIFIGSAILFAIGMLLLLISAVRIAVSLIKICYYLLALAVLLPVTALLALCVFVQWCAKHVMILARWLRGIPEPIESEPMITINITLDDDDNASIVELPRASFRRLRG
jgi:hypothetical protein